MHRPTVSPTLRHSKNAYDSQYMHPKAIKLNTLLSFNDFETTYERSEGLGIQRPREINLSTKSYSKYFAYEPSMDRPYFIHSFIGGEI